MRFGVGTYLWSKSEAALEMKRATDQAPQAPAQEPQNQAQERPPAQAGPPPQAPHSAVLLEELNALAPATADRVRQAWPFPGRGPDSLSADEAKVIHDLVEQLVAEVNADVAADPWAAPQDPQNAR
jgi:hypothetical protein